MTELPRLLSFFSLKSIPKKHSICDCSPTARHSYLRFSTTPVEVLVFFELPPVHLTSLRQKHIEKSSVFNFSYY